MAKPILISGIQPTGKLHIGNYLGALKNFVDLQNSGRYECYFFVADLHSLTEDFKSKEKTNQIYDVVLNYLAAGISPKKSTIFIQSQVSAHTELFWIFNAITPFGELSRMTQFKEKSSDQKNNINAGLFNYPVLQAADILLYNAQFVPVGEDQVQHLEFTRTLARKFNKKFGKTFTEPKSLLTEAPRLFSLDNPSRKMSKSYPSGCLFLNDSAETIRQKIKRAVTDSGREIKYSPKTKPAISNLLLIFAIFSGKSIKEVEKKFKNNTYAEFKNELAELIVNQLSKFQKNFKKFQKDSDYLTEILTNGAKKARQISQKTLREVKKKIGLII